MLESLARQMALAALDGRPSAERLVVSILNHQDFDAALASAEQTKAAEEDEVDSLFGEATRRELGERYQEFKQRYKAAVDSASVDDLVKLMEDFENAAKFPQSGNISGNI